MDTEKINQHFSEVAKGMGRIDPVAMQKAIDTLRAVRDTNSTVWIVGNGGSAATASHFANDLTKMAGINAVAVADMTPTVLAYGNDDGWENMFARPIERLSFKGDLVIAISCSGNSPNVVQAAYALPGPIVLTGNDENCSLTRCEPVAIIYAKSEHITVQEDIHLVVCHAIARILAE